MKIAIVGSRKYQRLELVREFVAGLDSDDVVVSGHGGAVDLTAEECAMARGMETVIFPADWDRYGKSAGPRRNEQIARECNWMRAYWDGCSRGTESAIRKARELGKYVSIVFEDGTQLKGDMDA
jgi:hypothetical protein